jgi:hypothetical protein
MRKKLKRQQKNETMLEKQLSNSQNLENTDSLM